MLIFDILIAPIKIRYTFLSKLNQLVSKFLFSLPSIKVINEYKTLLKSIPNLPFLFYPAQTFSFEYFR